MAHQITIEVEDSRFLSNLCKVLSQLKGVTVVRTRSNSKSKLSAYEQSLEDVEKGNVNSYDSADDFFNKMGI